MSRSGYMDDPENDWQLIKWRGQVASAIRGKRGQSFLRELVAALDALPERRLIAHELRRTEVRVDGQGFGQTRHNVCALGAIGTERGINLESLDPEDYYTLADTFGIAHQLVQEIEFINDEEGGYYGHATPEQRWQRVRDWAAGLLKP